MGECSSDQTWRYSFDEPIAQHSAPIWAGWLYTDTPASAESFDLPAGNLSNETYTSDGTKGAIALRSGTTPSPVSPVDRIAVRPNPFGAMLNLCQETDAATWQVFDAQGRQVLRLHTGSGSVQISTAHWPEGVYWLRCDTQWGTKQLKLFHQK
jgi:Secretion system C-terminal sorting domain